MPEIREVYEMITKQKSAEPGAFERQQTKQVRVARNRKIGGYAVGAVFVVAVVVGAILVTQQGENQTTPAERPPAPGTTSGPFLLHLETNEKTPLPANLSGGYAYVASPDGTRLVYSSGGECAGAEVTTIANIDGTDVQTLQSPSGFNICGARWSPDGTHLVYQERNGTDPYSVGNLFVHELSSGQRTQITDLELTTASWWFLSPRFDLTGQNVIYHLPRDSSPNTKWDSWSVSVTGGEPTLLVRDASFPILTGADAEGATILFLKRRPGAFDGDSIMLGRPTPPEDLRHIQVDANVSIWWPALSPDGFSIAYEDNGFIYWADRGGIDTPDKPRKLTYGSTAEWLDNDTLIVAP